MPQPATEMIVVRRSTGGDRARTASAIVHRALREEILSLARSPGAVIAEKDIAADHGVSRTPVREALLRLADEGLVVITPQSGTRVARIPIADLPEAIVARRALEEATARAAARLAGPGDIAILRAFLEDQRVAAERDDRDAFHIADDGLHRAIAEIAGHPRIWRIVLQIRTQLDRLRRLTLPEPGRMQRALGEHRAVVDAIAVGDSTAAATIMGAHIGRLHQSLAAVRDLNPDFFEGDLGEIVGSGMPAGAAVTVVARED